MIIIICVDNKSFLFFSKYFINKMTDISDIPLYTVVQFLSDNKISFVFKDDLYELLLETIEKQTEDTIFNQDSIIEWMMAYNAIQKKIDIPKYSILELENLSVDDVKLLAKSLDMKTINSKNLIKLVHILFFMKKLKDFESVYDNLPKRINNKELSKIPPIIKVGDIGTNTFNTGVGRKYWNGFTVISISPNGKQITVKYDSGKTEILEWRRPGHWIEKSKTAKDFRFNRISFGEKRTEVESGMF